MNFSKKRSVSHYSVIPRTVRSGAESRVTVYPIGKSKYFSETVDYDVRVVPMECFSHTWADEPEFDRVEASVQNGAISFTYTFEGEQSWTLIIRDPNTAAPLELQIYSLEEDLYGLNPYLGDLHSHSTGSDGREDPAIVAANYRKEGFDFFALTDHHKWEPSDEMIRAYDGIPLGIKLFHGEEVHVPNGCIHSVNFAGDTSVNAYYMENKEDVDAQIRAEAQQLQTPCGVNPVEYAYRKWVHQQIKASGGLSIVAHPNWIYRSTYHESMAMLGYVFEQGYYDAFELIGGQTVHENNMQTAFYQEARANGLRIPIVGSSDSHGTDPVSYFGIGRTIIFAKDLERESVFDAILRQRSVALECAYGEETRVYGTYRMVKYARFLLDFYFPAHDELCVEEGILMREYVQGNSEAGTALAALSGRVQRTMGRLLRGE